MILGILVQKIGSRGFGVFAAQAAAAGSFTIFTMVLCLCTYVAKPSLYVYLSSI